MSDRKYTKAMRSMVVTGLAFVVSYGISLVLTPYLTRKVGTEAYGFVSLARQCAQYAAIITMALDSFAARYIALEYHQRNIGRANIFFSSAFFGDAALGTAIMAAALTGIYFLNRLFHISPEIVSDVKLLFLAVFTDFWLKTVSGVFSASVYIKSKLEIAGIFRGLSYLAEAFVLVFLYACFPARVYYVGLGLGAASLVTAGANVWACRKYTPELSVRRGDVSLAAIGRLIYDGIWTSVNSVGGLLNHGLDLLVCNLMLYPAAIGQMAVAKTVQSIFSSMFALISQAFQPMLLKSYAEGNRDVLLKELRFAMKISGMCSNIGFAGFAALGTAYYQLWLPGQDLKLLYVLTLITIATVIPDGPMQPLYYIYTLTVKKRFPSLVTILGGVFNVAGMYLLIRHTQLGIYAVALTTAGVMAAINFITNPLYMAHVLGLPWHTFYPNILRNVISCGILTAVFKGFSAFYMPGSWPALAACILLYGLAGVPIHLLAVCQRGDWEAFRRRLSEKRKRKGPGV